MWLMKHGDCITSTDRRAQLSAFHDSTSLLSLSNLHHRLLLPASQNENLLLDSSFAHFLKQQKQSFFFSFFLPCSPLLSDMRELSELPWPAPVGQLEEESFIREQGDLSPWTPLFSPLSSQTETCTVVQASVTLLSRIRSTPSSICTACWARV